MLVSRIFTLVVGCEISNLIVGWNELRCLMKMRNEGEE